MTRTIDSHYVQTKVEAICRRYPFIGKKTLGYSLFGREIPYLQLGKGDRRVLYVGAHHGMEGITAGVLLRFAEEYGHALRAGASLYGLPIDYLYESRSIYLVPMLNPDGVELSVHRMAPKGPMQMPLIAMNRGSSDFVRWQANGRGVDLNHNYDAGFARYKQLEKKENITPGPTRFSGDSPESEPEVKAISGLIRMLGDVRLLITLHTQGEEIYWNYNGRSAPGSEAMARTFSQLTGYILSEAEGLSCYGGMKDWFIEEFDRPAFTFECGKGENPLPESDLPIIYERVKRALFCGAMMV